MKKIITCALCSAVLAGNALAYAAPGDKAGDIYYTDIKTYIYHSPITSYNIGGKTVIDAEILNWHYGFDVYWYGDTRRLEITDKGGEFNSLQAMSGELVESADGKIGDVYGAYYETDIVTTLNGKEIESYNFDGRTFIVAEAMRDFGYNVDWDENARTLTITKPIDFCNIATDYGTIKSMDNLSRKFRYINIDKNPVIFDENFNQFEIKLDSCRRIQGPGVGDDYIRLSDVQKAFNAECKLTEQTAIGHSEWVNGISYDTAYYTYYIDFNYDTAMAPELTPYVSDTEETDTPPVPVEAAGFGVDLGFVVNGKESEFVSMFAGKEYPASVWILDGEIYIPVYTLKMLVKYGVGTDLSIPEISGSMAVIFELPSDMSDEQAEKLKTALKERIAEQGMTDVTVTRKSINEMSVVIPHVSLSNEEAAELGKDIDCGDATITLNLKESNLV